MATNLVRQGYNGRKVRDIPSIRSETSQIDHSAHDRENEGVHPLEILNHTIEPNSESGSFELLSCCCPLHIDTEGMADQCFEEME